MARKIRLTRKRLEWAAPRNATLKGERLPPYSAAAAAKYQAELDKLVQRMQKEYNAEVRKLFRTHADTVSELAMDSSRAFSIGALAADASLASQARMLFNSLGKKWANIFGGRASSMTDRMIDGASMASKRALGDSLKKISGSLTIPVPVLPGNLQEAITAATAENVGLIRSIPQQYGERISQLVLRSVAAGGSGAQEIFEGIRHYDGLTENRAKAISIDQTRKITAVMNAERAKAVGIKKFEWIHSGGSTSPRKRHLELDGTIHSYDDLPVIDPKTGQRGLPGILIHCRCVAAPILELGDAEDTQ